MVDELIGLSETAQFSSGVIVALILILQQPN